MMITFFQQQSSSLKSLRMTGNKIGNRGAMHLAGMMQVNATLEELDVSDCDLVIHEGRGCSALHYHS